MKKNLFGFLIIALFLLLMFQGTNNVSASTNSTSKPSAITLNIITRHATDIWKPFRDAFLGSQAAIDADVTSMVFWSFLPSEWVSKAQTGQFDLAWGGGPTTFDQLAALNILAEINDTGVLTASAGVGNDINGVPLKRYNLTCTTDCSTNPVWIAAAISSFGFTINHDKLENAGVAPEDIPKTWNDLADPKLYRSGSPLIAIGNAPDTTSNTRIYEIILQALGWEAGWSLITAIAGNSQIEFGSTDVLTAVQTGEVGVGITIDFYGYASQFANPSTQYLIPLDQSIVNGDPIALLPGDPTKRDASNAFMEFVVSLEGQELWLDETINRLPSRKDVFSTAKGLTRNDLKAAFENAEVNSGIEFNDSLALSHQTFLLQYFQSVITDEHDDLRTNWGKIVQAYNDGDITREELSDWVYSFGYPLETIDEAITINNNIGLPETGQWSADIATQYAGVGALATAADPVANRTSPIDMFPPLPVSSTPTTTVSDGSSQPSTTSTSTPPTVTPGFELLAIVIVFPVSAVLLSKRKKE